MAEKSWGHHCHDADRLKPGLRGLPRPSFGRLGWKVGGQHVGSAVSGGDALIDKLTFTRTLN
jgi:hypothetical protein